MKTILLFSLLTTTILLRALPVLSQTGNYFSGTSAGANNTTGDYNSFAGYGAGVNNTSGSLNTAFGFYAGASNQATSYNTSIGAYAGYFTSSSFGENVFVGYRSGFYNSNGIYNVFLGSNAGYLNNSGSYNIFIGAGAGYDNTSGLSNTFMGYSSGANNTTANANTFIGNLSGFSNTTGANNSFLGSGTGTSNTIGANNSIVGSGAGYYTNASDNAFFGYYAGRNNSSADNNTFIGRSSGENNTIGHSNTFIGRSAGTRNDTGFNNTAIGYLSGSGINNLFNASAIGYRARVSSSNSLVLGSINGINGATATIKVGIGTTNPDYLLHVNGTAAKPGSSSWTVASDNRLKKDIEDFTDGLETLEKVHPVTFRYNGKAGMPTDKQYVGVIAQEMQKVAPYTVGEFTYQDTTGTTEKYLDYDATALTYMLVNAVKELNGENQMLKQELAELKQLINKQTPNNPVPNSAYLGQNYPNPYNQETTIPYFVPETATAAQILFYSNTGKQVYAINLTRKGQGEVSISNSQFANGTYIYKLIIDGKSIANNKLVLIR
jgi:hypothetical protein